MNWFRKRSILLVIIVIVVQNINVGGNDVRELENTTVTDSSTTTIPDYSNCENGTSNNTNCLKKEEETIPASTSVDYVSYVVVPSFLILGLVGNSLTIAVMCSKNFRSMSVSIVLIALSVSDTILICLHPHNKLFVRKLIGIDIRSQTLAGCKLFFLFFRTAKMSSSWLVVLLSVERFVAVVFPLKAKFVCTKKNVIICISIIYGALFLYNGTWTFASRIVNGNCVPHYPEPADLSHTFIIIGTLLYSIIPVSMMLVLTPIICFHLWRRIKNQSQLRTSSSNIEDEAKRTTVMLLGVSIAYTFLITPISIGHVISFTHDESIFETKHTGLAIYREISQILEQLNYSINFFLYVLCSKSFRDRVWIVLRCKKEKRNIGSSKPTKTSSLQSKGLDKQGSSLKQTVDIKDLDVIVETGSKNKPCTVGANWAGTDMNLKPNGKKGKECEDDNTEEQCAPPDDSFPEPPPSLVDSAAHPDDKVDEATKEAAVDVDEQVVT